MDNNTQFIIYLIIITLSLSIGLIKYNQIDSASKVIVVLLAITLISEAIAKYAAIKYQNNMPVYHFFNPIELFTISIYFNRNIEYFKKHSIGIYIGLFGILMSVLNSLFFQPINTLISYFLLFEGFCIIFMSLFSYRSMFEDIEMNVVRNPHFWFSSIFLFVSGITYSNWALYSYIGVLMIKIMPFLNILLFIVGVISYASFGLVFLLLPQKQKQ